MNEKDYIQGERAALTAMLRHCLSALGYSDIDAEKAKWILERESVISTLRSACDEFGDNEWQENLHLSDVIEKHLIRHIRT